MDVKLCENSNLSESVTLSLSRCDTIGLYYGARLRTPFIFLSFFTWCEQKTIFSVEGGVKFHCYIKKILGNLILGSCFLQRMLRK